MSRIGVSIAVITFCFFVYVEPLNFSERLSHLIFPGTNWCGIGNIASNYTDLGPNRDVDKCCRQHDSCKIIIEPGEYNYGLYNFYFIARLHCNCDKQFYDCLNGTTSAIADLIGNIYFNMLHYPCFAEKCPQNKTLPWGECQEHGNNTREYQWFDVKYIDTLKR